MKVTHIITGLSTGGAEMMLYKLLSTINSDEFDSEVISLTDTGHIADLIRTLGVPIYSLGMKKGRINPIDVFKLAKLLKKSEPDVVQTWLYHSDLIGGIAAKLSGFRHIIWNIRQSNIEPANNKRSTIWFAKACASISGIIPEKIICCSHAALNSHLGIGYSRKKMQVIPNGFDFDYFHPDPAARQSVRKELGLDSDALIVGLVARFDKQKDHLNFIQAACTIHSEYAHVHFLLCGEGISWENAQLASWIRERHLESYFYLLGLRTDIPRLCASLDIAVSSSLGEGFPNAVGEAMSCSVPCVVTDVGDSRLLVGDTGTVVPPQNPDALALAINDLLKKTPELRKQMGEKSRQRIIDHYSMKHITMLYEQTYRDTVQ